MKGEQKHDTLLSVCSIGFLIYGALVVSGIYTPISSKILVEDEERAKMVPHRGSHKDALGAGSGILCHVPMAAYFPGSFMAGGISCTDGGYYHHGI